MDTEPANQDAGDEDLGWKVVEPKRKKKKARSLSNAATSDPEDDWEDDDLSPSSYGSSASERRRQLLKELSARLHRDMQLRYAAREFELQRAMMGKGATKKIAASEKVKEDDSDDDEDALDARKGRKKDRPKIVDEATYKPRVYKWKLERKR